MKFDLCGRLLVVAEATTSPRLWRVAASLSSEGEAQLEPSFVCSDGVLAAGPSIGSLKYKHHFGLDCFSMRREHWALQASLTHCSNDDFLWRLA